MKKLTVCFITIFMLMNVYAFAAEKKRGILDKIEGRLDKIFGQEVETKTDVKYKKKNKISKNKTSQNKVVTQPCKQKRRGSLDKLEAGLDKLFGKEVHTKVNTKKK